MPLTRKAERLLIGLGVILVAGFLAARLYSFTGSLLGRLLFETAQSASVDDANGDTQEDTSEPLNGIDLRLWSENRIRAFQGSLAKHFAPPLALLNIPRVHLEVPVFNGTNEDILNRGVGRIIGTGRVGQNGNLGIAGHRDGFFRALKDLQIGDPVELITTNRTFMYQVDRISIVSPNNVRILKDRAVPTITLVTCYPFYFVGDAPQRYVLQCSLKRNELLTSGTQTKAIGLTLTPQ
jgi:sortase A